MDDKIEIGFEPEINFSNLNVKINPVYGIILKNGSPKLINKIEAIRQWITKFCITVKDSGVYEGTGYGTRFKELFGRKRIGYGFEEAEIERDFREGLPLCPAISEVSSFKISKSGKFLNIELQVELLDGDVIDIDIEKAYTIPI